MRTNAGADLQSAVMGADLLGETGTATSTTATSLTNTGAAFPTAGSGYAGHIVVAGTAYGVILSNTATILTVDKWNTPGSPGGAAAATPSGTSPYVILPGGAPAFWLALTENSTAPAAADTTLAAEIALAGGGLLRAVATYAHTLGAASYTLSKTFTVNASDAPPKTPAKLGVFNAQNGGRMLFETLISSPPTLLTSDTLTITETVSI